MARTKATVRRFPAVERHNMNSVVKKYKITVDIKKMDKL